MSQIINVPGHGQVEFPDGMTDAQIVAAIQRNAAPPEAATKPEFSVPGIGQVTTPPTESGFNLPAAVIAAGNSANKLSQGVRQAKLAAYGSVYQALSGLPGVGGFFADQADKNAQATAAQDADMADQAARYKQLQEVHPGSTMIGGTAPALPLGPTGLAVTSALSYGSPTERALNTGLVMLGNKGAQFLGGQAAKQYANGVSQAADQAAKNLATQPFRDAGYVTPPAQSNPTLVNRFLEGLAGGTKTEQAASATNQAVTDQLAKTALPGVASLSAPALKADRAQAGQAYEALKGLGPFNLDNQFQSEIAALRPSISSEVPELANGQIDTLIQGLSKPQLSGSTTIDLVKKLRYDASVNFKNRIDPDKLALAQAQSGAADALESAIERNLAANGNADALKAFQDARKRIAINYTVDNALNPTTGHVSAQDLARMADKGKPLSGSLKTAADFASSYPKSAQTVDSATKANPFSVVDTFMSGLAAASAHNPALMAGVFARPALRYGLLSGPYQRAMATPSASPAGLLGMKALDNKYAPYIGGLLGYEAASR